MVLRRRTHDRAISRAGQRIKKSRGSRLSGGGSQVRGDRPPAKGAFIRSCDPAEGQEHDEDSEHPVPGGLHDFVRRHGTVCAKVVQRIPVKIFFENGQDPSHLLRPGMSVEPNVKIQ